MGDLIHTTVSFGLLGLISLSPENRGFRFGEPEVAEEGEDGTINRLRFSDDVEEVYAATDLGLRGMMFRVAL